jgi:hypothetical protein
MTPESQHFLLSRPAKTLSLAQVFRMSDAEAEAMFCKVRWPGTDGAPVCPHGGVLPLNKILIGLYRKTGVTHKRPALTSRLYRMVERGRLYNVPEQKGVYSITSINADEAKGIFGGEQTGYDDDDGLALSLS